MVWRGSFPYFASRYLVDYWTVFMKSGKILILYIFMPIAGTPFMEEEE